MADVDLDLLASIASGGLGHWEDAPDGSRAYSKDEDCLGCLKDLQRIFRTDEFLAEDPDDTGDRPAFFAISQYNFARTDLVPLIVTYPEDYEVVYNSLKVCTLLTQTDGLQAATEAAQLEKMLQVCEAFLAQDALAVIVSLLAEPLSRHPKMNERDAALVQLVVVFLKNLCNVTTAATRKKIPGAARTKAAVFQKLMEDSVLDLMLLMAQHCRERPFKNDAHVLLEFFVHVLTDISPAQTLDLLEKPEEYFKPPPKPKASSRTALPAARLPSKRPPLPSNIQNYKAPTFARAVYVKRHLDHSNNVLVRQSVNKPELPSLNATEDKRHAQASRNTRAATTTVPSDTNSIASAVFAASPLQARALSEFTMKFMSDGYAPLMSQVFKELQPGVNVSKLSPTDFANFAAMTQHCTALVRLKEERKLAAKMQAAKDGAKAAADAAAEPTSKENATTNDGSGLNTTNEDGSPSGDKNTTTPEISPFSYISTTMGWETLHWVVTLLVTIPAPHERHDDKPDKLSVMSVPSWELIRYVVPLLKELLLTLDLARVTGNSSDQLAAGRVQQRLLHDDKKDSGLLPVLTKLVKNYNFRYQPRSYAVELVETLHVVLGMLDRLAASGLQVQHAKRKVKRSKKKKTPKSTPAAQPTPPADGAAVQQPAAVEQEGVPVQDNQEKPQSSPGAEVAADASPTSLEPAAANTAEGEQQRGEAAAVPTQFPESLDFDGPVPLPTGAVMETLPPSLDFEAPVEVAPPTATETEAVDIPTEKPADGEELQKDAEAAAGTAAAEGEQEAAPAVQQEVIQDSDTEEETDSDDDGPAYQEVRFDLEKRIRQECAQPVIVHFYTWLLQGYRTNSAFTNHAILTMYKRIADGVQLEGMLYQIGVLRVMHAIMDDYTVKNNPAFAELIRFCKRVTRNLLSKIAPAKYKQQQASDGDVADKEKAAGGNNDKEGFEEDVQASAEDLASDGEDEEDKRYREAQKLKEEQRKVKLEECRKMMEHEQVPGMVCVDILFYKGPQVATQIASNYHWEKALEDDYRARPGGFGAGNAETGQFAFASYRDKGRGDLFSEEQSLALRDAFECCNGHKDCLERLVDEFSGAFKKVHISRQLKAMGLFKGKLTSRQEERIRDLYEVYKAEPTCFDTIAQSLDCGFTANQIKGQLRKIGAVESKYKRNTGGSTGLKRVAGAAFADWSDDDEALGDDNSDDDNEGAVKKNAEQRFDEVFGGGASDDDNDTRPPAAVVAKKKKPVARKARSGDADDDGLLNDEEEEEIDLDAEFAEAKAAHGGKPRKKKSKKAAAAAAEVANDADEELMVELEDEDDEDDDRNSPPPAAAAVETADLNQKKKKDKQRQSSPAIAGGSGSKRSRPEEEEEEEDDDAAAFIEAKKKKALDELRKRLQKVQGSGDTDAAPRQSSPPAGAKEKQVDVQQQQQGSPDENNNKAEVNKQPSKLKKGKRLLKKATTEEVKETAPAAAFDDLFDF